MTAILIIVVVVLYLTKPKPLPIEIEYNNIRIRGTKLMATMNTLQKIKLTALPNGAVLWDTLEAHIADGGVSVELEAIEGEHAFYAKAIAVGQTVVGFSVVSSDGNLLADLIQIDVVEAPANSLEIVASDPIPL